MTGIVLSVRSQWAGKIYGLEKRWELRKTAPRDAGFLAQVRRPVYLYEPEKHAVTGVFHLGGIVMTDSVRTAARYQLCLDEDEIEAYGPGRDGQFHLWRADTPVQWERPLMIGCFGLLRPPQSWCYITDEW